MVEEPPREAPKAVVTGDVTTATTQEGGGRCMVRQAEALARRREAPLNATAEGEMVQATKEAQKQGWMTVDGVAALATVKTTNAKEPQRSSRRADVEAEDAADYGSTTTVENAGGDAAAEPLLLPGPADEAKEIADGKVTGKKGEPMTLTAAIPNIITTTEQTAIGGEAISAMAIITQAPPVAAENTIDKEAMSRTALGTHWDGRRKSCLSPMKLKKEGGGGVPRPREQLYLSVPNTHLQQSIVGQRVARACHSGLNGVGQLIRKGQIERNMCCVWKVEGGGLRA
ncbi:unnamed protein product [Linum trigynum]|uniref:Uncharacterized protein n=1 Tax=Linum trigynum TaxID=586398 RepID=A0AAV2E4J6_9ROSI